MSLATHKTPRVLTLLMALALSVGLAAAEPAVREYKIAVQPLDQALREFALSAGMDLLFPPELAAGRRNADLNGAFSLDQALATLLRGTGLEYSISGSRIVISRAGSARTTSATEVENAIQLSQADQSQMQKVESRGEAKTEDAANKDSALAQDQPKETEIVVTGSRIRGAKPSAPTINITREDIKKSGVASLERAFALLPQNFNEINADSATGGGNLSAVANGNYDRAAGIDLRGLGADSTLTLLNGTRRAASAHGRVVDISAIPLSVVERVEIVTGGRSAIYGSDAVGGVVNIITRHEFEGAESDVLVGGGEYGGERVQASQIVGAKSANAGIVAAYDFIRDWPVDVVDAGLVQVPTPRGSISRVLESAGDNKRHSGYLAGHLELTPAIGLFLEGLYSHRQSDILTAEQFPGALTERFQADDVDGEQYSVSGGVRFELGSGWRATASGVYSAVDNEMLSNLHQDDGVFPYDQLFTQHRESRITSGSLLAEGPLFEIGRLKPRAAVGAEVRGEKYGYSQKDDFIFGGVSSPNTKSFSADRTVKSAFVELLFPLDPVELTVAGRYDDYDGFGSTVNPQVGLVWEAVAGLSFKGGYSTAFRAPALVELEPIVLGGVLPIPSPTGGSRPVLFSIGNDPNIEPEKARTWTVGIDYEPEFAPSTTFSVSYFNIRYKGRIDTISSSERFNVLLASERYGSLLNSSPTLSDVAAAISEIPSIPVNATGQPWAPNPNASDLGLLAAFPNLALFENRSTNISVEKIEGVDFSVVSEVLTGKHNLSLGLNATYTPRHRRSLTADTASFDRLNEPGYPSDFRFRATVDWMTGPFGWYGAVNFVQGYPNPFSTPSHLDSSATVDLSMRFDSEQASSFPIEGFSAVLGVQNLLDSEPPTFLNDGTGSLYDSTNALSIGRYVSLRLSKRW